MGRSYHLYGSGKRSRLRSLLVVGFNHSMAHRAVYNSICGNLPVPEATSPHGSCGRGRSGQKQTAGKQTARVQSLILTPKLFNPEATLKTHQLVRTFLTPMMTMIHISLPTNLCWWCFWLELGFPYLQLELSSHSRSLGPHFRHIIPEAL